MPPIKNKNNLNIEKKININEELIDKNIILLEEYNKILKKYWNYDSLKPTQFEIIKKMLVYKKDVCAILATGFGKSICYQLPHLICSKSVIVISPLIALMYEQGNELKDRKIPVAVFNSESSIKQKNTDKCEILDGENKVIYMTPEFFVKSETFIKGIEDELAFVCIDEAHAVSTWGLDFRSSYTKLNLIKEWLPNTPVLTLTATASTKVREDIIEILNLDNPDIIVGNFDRPNLLIRVEQRDNDIMTSINTLLEKYKDEYVIIYCSTRDETDLLASKITSIKCKSYHAGINDKIRSKVQQEFIEGKIKCIIATIAFGMGINIPNVRLVIHNNCPKNLESYYQEIGRAGRDNKLSECVLFFSLKDFKTNRYFLQSITNPVQKVYQENQIKQIEKYVYSNECRRKVILQSFGQNISSCQNCDNCLKFINNKNLKINQNLIDYTKQVYILLNALYRINDKFGCGMLINILLGKGSKVKKWMLQYSEYGTGLSFGNEEWWKNLIRLMINDDLIQENQVTKSFFTTFSLTKKGIDLRNKLIELYPQYINLLVASEDEDEDNYNEIKICYEEIKVAKKISKVNKTTKTNKSNNLVIKNIKKENEKETEKDTEKENAEDDDSDDILESKLDSIINKSSISKKYQNILDD
jgi:RecQ family ATP-dependent DNA helicase